jgi:hypothetical protein
MLVHKNKNIWPIANVKLYVGTVKLAIFVASILTANAQKVGSKLV